MHCTPSTAELSLQEAQQSATQRVQMLQPWLEGCANVAMLLGKDARRKIHRHTCAQKAAGLAHVIQGGVRNSEAKQCSGPAWVSGA